MRCVKFIRCPIWLQSMLSNANPEKETGNAQTGACVDVLPRCYDNDDVVAASQPRTAR